MIEFVQLCLKFFLFIFLGVSNVSHFYCHVYMGYGHLLRIDSPPPPTLLQLCVYGLHFLVMCMWVMVTCYEFFCFFFFGEGFLTQFWWCGCAKVTRKDILTTIVRLSGLQNKTQGFKVMFLLPRPELTFCWNQHKN